MRASARRPVSSMLSSDRCRCSAAASSSQAGACSARCSFSSPRACRQRLNKETRRPRSVRRNCSRCRGPWRHHRRGSRGSCTGTGIGCPIGRAQWHCEERGQMASACSCPRWATQPSASSSSRVDSHLRGLPNHQAAGSACSDRLHVVCLPRPAPGRLRGRPRVQALRRRSRRAQVMRISTTGRPPVGWRSTIVAMEMEEAEEVLAEAELVPCLSAAFLEAKELRDACLTAEIPVVLDRGECCGKGGPAAARPSCSCSRARRMCRGSRSSCTSAGARSPCARGPSTLTTLPCDPRRVRLRVRRAERQRPAWMAPARSAACNWSELGRQFSA